MNIIKSLPANTADIHSEILQLTEPFIDFASQYADMPGTVLLMSGGDSDCARYHILAADPWLSLSARREHIEIRTSEQTFCFDSNPFDALKEIIRHFHFDTNEDYPVISGLFGYFAYDLKDHLEKLPRTSTNDLNLPDMLLYVPSFIAIHDKWEKRTKMFARKGFNHKALNIGKNESFKGNSKAFKSAFTRESYMEAVRAVKEYIAAGDIYQVNMSQRFETDFSGSPFALFKRLYELNPAPFFAYVNAGDHFMVSTSPERFVLQQGEKVEARPIKGTRPRGKTPEDDARLKSELAQSRKDDAELSMIVDLLRNDIGKVCAAGSVRVTEHKRIEAYKNVWHLVSVVEGTLDADKDSVDLLKATFPGGSITGCPKIRAMEIIDELEPHRRHIYTGSIGYVSFHDTMDLSIAIRTATILNGKIIFSVGGGVVYDSDPADEYEETLHKGQTLMDVFKGTEHADSHKYYAWINGILKPADEAAIPLTAQGFQFGYGFFETIRVDKGEPQYLKEHLERFYKTWRQLFDGTLPDMTWEDIISQVICKNDLQDKVAAIKIIAAKGDREHPPYNHILAVMARPYTHRLANQSTERKQGLNLVTYPQPRQTPLADHKTLNYLYYYLAGKWAVKQGADEALILNPDGSISETNTANILLIKDKTVFIPKSPHVLPGIMQNVLIQSLSEQGYEINHCRIMSEELFSADRIILTNSLMCEVPALSLDGRRLKTRIRFFNEFCENNC